MNPRLLLIEFLPRVVLLFLLVLGDFYFDLLARFFITPCFYPALLFEFGQSFLLCGSYNLRLIL